MSRIRWVLLVCGVLGSAPAFGASPDPKTLEVPPEELSKARALVRLMGSDVYREREDAQAELAKMGRRAKQVLNEAVLNDADPEVRLRASRLLPKAAAADLAARIETFLEDKEGKYEHDLPGLKQFRKELGATEKARALYVEMLKSPYNLDMFAAIDKGESEGGRAIADRRTAIWFDMNGGQFGGRFPGGKPFTPKQPTLADLAAIYYGEAIVPTDSIPKTGQQWQMINGTQFLYQPAVQSALTNSNAAHSEVFRTIMGKWLATRTDPMELTNLSHQLGNTTLRQFKESNTLLRRIVMTDGVQGYAKGQALNWMIQIRGKEETPFFRAILKNQLRVGDYPDLYPNEKDPDRKVAMGSDQVVQPVWFQKPGQPNGEQHACLLKDVALAYFIVQGGGNIRDYGFETQQPNMTININQLGFGQYAFTSDVKRAEGFMKFGWKHLKDGIEPPAKADPKNPQPGGSTPPPPDGPIKPRPGVRPLPAVPPQVAPALPPVPAPIK